MASDDERARESREALERAARESETIGGSALGRAGQRMSDHFAAKDAGDADPIELWGRRIGRALSLIGVIGLTWWLGVQLRWW
ncbi:MAG TPA: hypothetical protein VHN20_07275 [Beijerinckiaceae bacterium]|nr:hypothetical protein [Beijerinckiaceae bacterium]